ncbi:MAG: phosphate ABC transporter substrate-binding protein [Steroidobacteraceae bacterium]
MEFARPIIVALQISLGITAAVAHADVVAVVSDTSAVMSLNKEQVVAIFLGKSAHFPNGTQAVPIDQADSTAARTEFYARFAGKSPAQLRAHWSKIIFTGRGRPPRVVANSSEIKKLLLQNPNAIGYIEQSAVDSSVRVVLSQ